MKFFNQLFKKFFIKETGKDKRVSEMAGVICKKCKTENYANNPVGVLVVGGTMSYCAKCLEPIYIPAVDSKLSDKMVENFWQKANREGR